LFRILERFFVYLSLYFPHCGILLYTIAHT
jgi:hypothetical protein